jgi:Pvc16 N-terminal domain
VDCRYLVTAWTSEIRDEHSLLGATLAALLCHDEVSADYLRGPFATVTPRPSIAVAANGGDNSDFWSALGGQLKPGLDMVVTATIDTSVFAPTGPDVERYLIRTAAEKTATGKAATGKAATGERHLVGGHASAPPGTVVTTPRGAGRVGPDGEFLVPARPGDDVTVGDTGRGRVSDRGPIEMLEQP